MGVFEDFDEDTIARNKFDVARIHVSTERKSFIDVRVKIRVVGAEYTLWMVEEGGSWRCLTKERGWPVDDVMSVGSREAEVLGDQKEFFSDDDVTSFSSHNSGHLGIECGLPRLDSRHGTEKQTRVQEEVSRGPKCLVPQKVDLFLNEQVDGGHVAGGSKDVDGREKEVDSCIR